jgi:hypothetical protein
MENPWNFLLFDYGKVEKIDRCGSSFVEIPHVILNPLWKFLEPISKSDTPG